MNLPPLPPYVCIHCGLDLTPTPEQLEALVKFGNPLRRPPCLKTESGLHQVSQEQIDRRVAILEGDSDLA